MIFKSIQNTPLFDLICAFLRTFSIFYSILFPAFYSLSPDCIRNGLFFEKQLCTNPPKNGHFRGLTSKKCPFSPLFEKFLLASKTVFCYLIETFHFKRGSSP